MRGRRYIHDYEVVPASATATVEGFAAMAAGITRADIEPAVEPAVEPAGSTVPAQIGERAALG